MPPPVFGKMMSPKQQQCSPRYLKKAKKSDELADAESYWGGNNGSNRLGSSGRKGFLCVSVLALIASTVFLFWGVGFPDAASRLTRAVSIAANDAVLGSDAGIGDSSPPFFQRPTLLTHQVLIRKGEGGKTQVGVSNQNNAESKPAAGVAVAQAALAASSVEDPDFKVLADRTQRCSCITRDNPAVREIRFYDVNRTESYVHGLRHELRNYQAMLIEAMIARRLFVPTHAMPKLNADHNFHRSITLNQWEDYLELETSTITLTDVSGPTATLICKAALSDCVVGRDERQGLLQAMKRLEMKQPEQWRPQVVDMKAMTPEASDVVMMHRHPGNAAIYNSLPYAEALTDKYVTNVTLARSRRAQRSAKAILRSMRRRRDMVVVAHVRRGDKLHGVDAVAGLDESTSPLNILRVLNLISPPSSASVYIMTNEWNGYHFDPIRKEYDVRFWFDFKEMKDLLSGCQIPFYPWAADKPCESLLAYQIEEEMMALVHPSKRIVTFAADGDYQWRHFDRAPYLHPAREYMPPTTAKWCKAIGQPCKYNTHCCSLRCEVAAVGNICEEWQPPPPASQKTTTTLVSAVVR